MRVQSGAIHPAATTGVLYRSLFFYFAFISGGEELEEQLDGAHALPTLCVWVGVGGW